MSLPLTIRRASVAVAQAGSKVLSSGSVAGGGSGPIGSMNLPPARGFQVVAGEPRKNEDKTYRHGGHTNFVLEPGDHDELAPAGGRSKPVGHVASSLEPVKAIPVSKGPRLADGELMPPGSMDVLPGTGLRPEMGRTTGRRVELHLGPLNESEQAAFDYLMKQGPVNYQRAGIDAPNCITVAVDTLSFMFSIPKEEIAPKLAEMPYDQLKRVGPTIIEYAGRGELKTIDC